MTTRPGKYDPLKPKLVVPKAREKLDVHQAITDKIVAAIEAGAGTFEMPWHRPGISFDIPKNALTGNAYRGSNILSLWIDADDKKFEHQVWSTFKQWQELGAQVRKGEKGSLIVKYGQWTPREAKADSAGGDEAEQSKLMFAKAAWVFNVAQVDGFPPDEPSTCHLFMNRDLAGLPAIERRGAPSIAVPLKNTVTADSRRDFMAVLLSAISLR